MSKFPTDQETALWITLSLVHRKIYRAMDFELKAAGLPPLRWYDILWALERNPKGLRALELRSLLIFEQSNVSRLLHRMIGEGFVEERVFAADRRGKVLRITAPGRKVRRKMWDVYGPLIHEQMSAISDPKDSQRVDAVLRELLEQDS